MKKYLLFVGLLFCVCVIFAQDLSYKLPPKGMKAQNQDIMRQYRKFRRKRMRCCDCEYPSCDSILVINLHHLYYMDTMTLNKSIICSDGFLESLEGPVDPSIKEKIHNCMGRLRVLMRCGVLCHKFRYRPEALVTSLNGDLIAFYDGYDLHPSTVRIDAAMSKYIVANDVAFVFTLFSGRDYTSVLVYGNYFGIDKTGGIHVFNSVTLDSIVMCPIRDYPDEKWPLLFCDPWRASLERQPFFNDTQQIEPVWIYGKNADHPERKTNMQPR